MKVGFGGTLWCIVRLALRLLLHLVTLWSGHCDAQLLHYRHAARDSRRAVTALRRLCTTALPAAGVAQLAQPAFSAPRMQRSVRRPVGGEAPARASVSGSD